jgi:hypothetical protein
VGERRGNLPRSPGLSDLFGRRSGRSLPAPKMKKYVSVILALHLVSMNVIAWTNGELLVWMDSDRGYALAAAAKKCETEFGIKVTIESPKA